MAQFLMALALSSFVHTHANTRVGGTAAVVKSALKTGQMNVAKFPKFALNTDLDGIYPLLFSISTQRATPGAGGGGGGKRAKTVTERVLSVRDLIRLTWLVLCSQPGIRCFAVSGAQPRHQTLTLGVR